MKLRIGVLAAALALAPACSLVRSPILAPMDAGLDTPGLDAPPPDIPGLDAPDTPIDAPIPDVPGLDAPDTPMDAPIDTGVDAPVDTGVDAPVDTGVDAPVDTGVDAPIPDVPPATCSSVYGSAPSYFECMPMSDAQCMFYAALADAETCGEFCRRVGGSCLDSVNNQNSAAGRCTTNGGPLGCDALRGDLICICAAP